MKHIRNQVTTNKCQQGVCGGEEVMWREEEADRIKPAKNSDTRIIKQIM